MWRDQANELADDLTALGRTVGLTQTGQLVTMPGVDIDAVHAPRPVICPDLDMPGYCRPPTRYAGCCSRVVTSACAATSPFRGVCSRRPKASI
jgi:hypothetical protein